MSDRHAMVLALACWDSAFRAVQDDKSPIEHIASAIKSAVEAEREACAKVAKTEGDTNRGRIWNQDESLYSAATNIERDIRARGTL
jgi:predicted transcriptional regulator